MLLVILFMSGYGLGLTQAPGYQGNRFLVKYDLSFFWDFYRTIPKTPSVFHKVSLEYVITETHSIGLRYQTDNLKVFAGDHFLAPIDDGEHVGDLNNQNITFFVNLFTFRNSGNLAPSGVYWTFGASLQTFKYDGIIDVFNLEIVEGSTKRGIDVSLLIGTGKKFILKDRLVLDFGFEFNVPVSAFRHNPLGGTIETSDVGVLNRQFQIAQFNLGFGFLSF